MALKNLPPTGATSTLSVVCPAETPALSGVRRAYDSAAVTMTDARQSAPGETPGWATADFTNASGTTKPVTLVATCTLIRRRAFATVPTPCSVGAEQ